jgi:hypothetical protein
MTLGTAGLLRRCVGWCASALLICIFIIIVDGLVGSFTKKTNLIELTPGAASALNGLLPPNVKDHAELLVSSVPAGVTLAMEKTYTGFWMGGTMWRANLFVPENTAPGEYLVTVRGPADTKIFAQNSFVVRVYSSAEEMQAASPHYTMNFFGVQPFSLAASLTPAVLLVVACLFLSSKLLEQLMAREGKAEIYMLKRSPEGFMISFGLGADQGLKMGDQVDILNEQNLRIGAAQVVQCAGKDCVALVSKEADHIEVGHIVALRDALAHSAV